MGGAHRNKEQAILSIKKALMKYLDEFKKYTREEIFEQRKKKFLSIGKEQALTVFSRGTSWVRKENLFVNFKNFLFKFKKQIIVIFLLIFSLFLFLF